MFTKKVTLWQITVQLSGSSKLLSHEGPVCNPSQRGTRGQGPSKRGTHVSIPGMTCRVEQHSTVHFHSLLPLCAIEPGKLNTQPPGLHDKWVSWGNRVPPITCTRVQTWGGEMETILRQLCLSLLDSMAESVFLQVAQGAGRYQTHGYQGTVAPQEVLILVLKPQ